MTGSAKRFTLIDVPSSMRREGWTVGAALMERWFNANAWTMPANVKTGDAPAPSSAIDTSTRMRWALGFARVSAANSNLLSTWSQGERRAKSGGQVANQLRRWITHHGLSGRQPFRFGDLSQPIVQVDRFCAINRDIVESSFFGPVDDFYAAFGNAAVKLAVSAQVTPVTGGWEVKIDQAATYLRDTYDFNGDQPLGSWGPDGFSRVAVLAPGIEIDPNASGSSWLGGQRVWSVDNESFRDYRARFNKGGDFIVFSDLNRVPLASPVTYTVRA
jgi:hypothetical protein